MDFYLSRRQLMSAVFGLFAFMTTPSDAADISWITDADGNWNDATNWSTGTIPTSADDVTIDQPSDIVVTYDDDQETGSVGSITTTNSFVVTGRRFDIRAGQSTFDGAFEMTDSLLFVAGDLTVDVNGPTNILNGGVSITNSAEVNFNQISSIEYDFGVRQIIAQTTGSAIRFPGMNEIAIGNGALEIEAVSGGTVEMPDLTLVDQQSDTPRFVQVRARGTDSLIDISNLASVNNLTNVTVESGGTILWVAPTEVDTVNITAGDGTLATDQLTAVTNGGLLAKGGTPDFSSVSNIENSRLIAQLEGSLELPSVTSYAISQFRDMRSLDAGSVIDLPMLATISLGNRSTLEVEASNGGEINLSGLNSIDSPDARPVLLSASGTGAVIRIPNLIDLSTVSDIQVVNGGEIDWSNPTTTSGLDITISGDNTQLATDQLTTFNDGRFVVRSTDYSLPQLTNADSANLVAGANAEFQVPDLINYSTGLLTRLESDGSDSMLDVSNLTQVTIEPRGGLFIQATSGGTVDVSSLTSIVNPDARTMEFLASGSNGLIRVPNLLDYSAVTQIQVERGGEIQWSRPASLDGIRLTVSDDDTIFDTDSLMTFNDSRLTVRRATREFVALNDVDDSSIAARDGGEIRIPLLTEYTVTSGTTNLEAIDGDAHLNLPDLTRINLTGGNLNITGTRGLVTLSGLTTIENAGRDLSIIANNAGGVVDISSLSDLSGVTSIRATNGGEVRWTNPTSLVDARIILSGDGKLMTDQVIQIEGSRLTLLGTARDFVGLESMADTSVIIDEASSFLAQQVTTMTASSSLATLRTSNDSIIDLPNLTALTTENVGSFEFTASSGGEILMPSLTSLVSDDRKASTLTATDGGLIDAPNLETVHAGSMQVRRGGMIELASEVTFLGTRISLPLEEDGSFSVDTFILEEGSSTTGLGDVAGDLINRAGRVDPGGFAIAKNLLVAGEYQQLGDGELSIEVESAGEFDQLTTTNSASLAGTLRLTTEPNEMFPLGEMLTLVDAGELEGKFDIIRNVQFNAGNGEFGHAVIYDGTSAVSRVTLIGDVDFDDDVDTADRNRVVVNWTGAMQAGTGGFTWLDGDFDGDGDIDTADQTSLVRHWTGALEVPANATVGLESRTISIPEPSFTSLWWSAVMAALMARFIAAGRSERCARYSPQVYTSISQPAR